MRERIYFVYMIASKSRVLYIGMTNNLRHRVWEHKNELIDGFTKTYSAIGWFSSNRSTTSRKRLTAKSS